MADILGDGHSGADLVVTGVRKSFDGTDALKGASVRVEAGQMLALLGPSGCGKTTLLRTIAGLEVPDEGTVEVGGETLTGPEVLVAPERRRIGMVFQDWALFPHLTVGRNVAYGVHKDDDRDERVASALDMVGLTGMADRLPSTLSGGQQQRVALARALAPHPSVLLLDEPFSNLDTALRVQVRGEVHALLADLGVTTVFVTHDQEEAFVLGDQVAVMTRGEVVQQASPADLYAAPVTRWVAEFVGDANLLAGAAEGTRAGTVLGDVALLAEHRGTVDVLLRPEELRIAPSASAHSGESGVQAGRRHDDDPTSSVPVPLATDPGALGGAGVVELVEFFGHDTVYVVGLDSEERVRVRAGSAPEYGRGDPVLVTYAGPPALAYPTD